MAEAIVRNKDAGEHRWFLGGGATSSMRSAHGITSAALGLADARQVKHWAVESFEPLEQAVALRLDAVLLGRSRARVGVLSRGSRSVLAFGEPSARR